MVYLNFFSVDQPAPVSSPCLALSKGGRVRGHTSARGTPAGGREDSHVGTGGTLQGEGKQKSSQANMTKWMV